jgi:endogenous inhibitor of DNA gyrase (YacG/DUF329 family)
MEEETKELKCPDCGAPVDENGDSFYIECFYCPEGCKTCGDTYCDHSC